MSQPGNLMITRERFSISHYPGEGHLVQVLRANAKDEGFQLELTGC